MNKTHGLITMWGGIVASLSADAIFVKAVFLALAVFGVVESLAAKNPDRE